MPNNEANPFDAAAGAVMHDDAKSVAAQPEAPAAGQLVNDYPTPARYVPASHNVARSHDDIAPPAVDQRAVEAADLVSHAAILRASADIEREQLGADLAQRVT